MITELGQLETQQILKFCWRKGNQTYLEERGKLINPFKGRREIKKRTWTGKIERATGF